MDDTDLRWRLRQLPRELDPPHDLWPGIEARLRRAPAAPARRRWPGWLALAACLCLAVGVAWLSRPAAPAGGLEEQLVQREAEALTREYQAALDQYGDVPVPGPLAPALDVLDRSAADIRDAIAADPGAGFLLDRLRQTYVRRLALTQRAVTG